MVVVWKRPWGRDDGEVVRGMAEVSKGKWGRGNEMMVVAELVVWNGRWRFVVMWKGKVKRW